MSSESGVGEVIAQRYELLDVIGRGGQGAVWRARDRTTDKLVAVKVIEGRAAKNPETVERIAREQQALVALSGTHAVEFLDLCTAEHGALCLVMELLHGQEFESWLVQLENRGQRCSAHRLWQILEPIATTLIKAHSVGIIHRDLKPGNIFVIDEAAGGGSRLLDFGFARLTDSRRVTATGMVMGSPSYIAPEMWKGQGRDADHRVDIYAFGVIVYRALAGELPFPNMAMHETLVAVTTAPRPSLLKHRPELPARIDDWVKRVLAIDIDARFPTLRACWDELLWSLDLAELPLQPSTGLTTPPPEISKIKEWLDAPIVEPVPLDSVWTRAAGALKRWLGAGSSPAPKPNADNLTLLTPIVPVGMTPSETPAAPKRLPKLPPPLRIAGLSPPPKTAPPPPPRTTPPSSAVTASSLGFGAAPSNSPVPRTPPPLPIERRPNPGQPVELEPEVLSLPPSLLEPASTPAPQLIADLTGEAALMPASERVPSPQSAETALDESPAAPSLPRSAANGSPSRRGEPSRRGKRDRRKKKRNSQAKAPDVELQSLPSNATPMSAIPSTASPHSGSPLKAKSKWKSRRRRGAG